MKTGTYVGDIVSLRGKTALVMSSKVKGQVLIQADDRLTGYAYGWHEFPETDWEITT